MSTAHQELISPHIWKSRAALLGALVIPCYLAAATGYFLSDDFFLLTLVRTTADPIRLFDIPRDWFFFRPFALLVWWILAHFGGDSIAVFRVAGIFFHLLNALLLCGLLRRISNDRSFSLVAALLFALSPLAVETVVWSACFYDLLSVLWCLITLNLALAFWQDRSEWSAALSVLTYQLALWSKESAFTLPFVALLVAVLIRPRPQWRKIAVLVAFYSFLLAANLGARFAAWGNFGGYPGARTDFGEFGLPNLLSALRVLAVPLNYSLIDQRLGLAIAAPAVLLFIAALCTTRGRRRLAAGIAAFTLTLLPVLNILPIGSDLQNSRLLYLPLAAGAAALSAAVCAGVSLLERFSRVGARAVLWGIVLACAVLTAVHVGPWIVAAQGVPAILDEFHGVLRTAPGAAQVVVRGVPDNYQGAYLFRLGLGPAYQSRHGGGFEFVATTSKQEIVTDPSRDRFELSVRAEPSGRSWRVTQARAVTAAALRGAEAEKIWRPAECGASKQLRLVESRETPDECTVREKHELTRADTALLVPLDGTGMRRISLRVHAAENSQVRFAVRLQGAPDAPVSPGAVLHPRFSARAGENILSFWLPEREQPISEASIALLGPKSGISLIDVTVASER